MIEQLREIVAGALTDNQFFQGGFVLAALTAIIAYFRKVPEQIWSLFVRWCTTHVIIDSRENAFIWFQMWLSQQNYGKKANRVMLKVASKSDAPRYVGEDESFGKVFEDKYKLKVYFTPAPGTHFIRYKNKRMMVQFDQEKMGGAQNANMAGAIHETLSVRFLGKDRSIMSDIIKEAEDLITPKDIDCIDILIDTEYGEWQRTKRRPGRPSSSLIYHNNVFEEALEDVKEFQDSYEWYRDMGIPYRRGYLLHGPPGTGKTSLVLALATELNMDVAVLNLNKGMLTINRFTELVTGLPKNTLLLMEDVHVIQNKFDKENTKEDIDDRLIDFPSFVNTLDGIYSPEGSMIIMTTNYRDKLDPVLTRPGRIDKEFFLDNASRYQVEHMFKRFYPEANGAALDFANKIPEFEISMARLQGHFMKYSPDEAVENYKELMDEGRKK